MGQQNTEETPGTTTTTTTETETQAPAPQDAPNEGGDTKEGSDSEG